MDDQLRTTDMLRAVGAGNWLLKRLGLGETYGIVYGGRPRGATLLDAQGKTLAREEHDDPWLAIGALLLRFLSEEDT